MNNPRRVNFMAEKFIADDCRKIAVYHGVSLARILRQFLRKYRQKHIHLIDPNIPLSHIDKFPEKFDGYDGDLMKGIDVTDLDSE